MKHWPVFSHLQCNLPAATSSKGVETELNKSFRQINKSTGLRWLNRVMQDHEARANDLNRKLIFSFFFAIFLIKATET